MKKRAFFLTSLLLVVGALAAQVASFFLILVAAADAVSRFWVQIYQPVFVQSPTPTAPVEGFYWIVMFSLLIGLVLAVFSLASVTVSFRKRESGWRFITILLLVLYVGSWMPLLFHNHL